MCITILSGGGGSSDATGPSLYFPTSTYDHHSSTNATQQQYTGHGLELLLLQRKNGEMVSECLCAGKLEFAIAEKTIYARFACMVSFSQKKNNRIESN